MKPTNGNTKAAQDAYADLMLKLVTAIVADLPAEHLVIQKIGDRVAIYMDGKAPVITTVEEAKKVGKIGVIQVTADNMPPAGEVH